MERFHLLCTVSIILIKDNKVFLIRRANTGFFDGMYEVPAGHLDGGEPITKAASREAKEEAGIDIKAEDLKVVHIMHRYGSQKERIEFFLVAENWIGEPRNVEPEKCDHADWFDMDNLPENLVPKFKHALTQFRAGEIFSEFDWEKKSEN